MGLLDKRGVDKMGLLRKFVDEMGVNQMGCYHKYRFKEVNIFSLNIFYSTVQIYKRE